MQCAKRNLSSSGQASKHWLRSRGSGECETDPLCASEMGDLRRRGHSARHCLGTRGQQQRLAQTLFGCSEPTAADGIEACFEAPGALHPRPHQNVHANGIGLRGVPEGATSFGSGPCTDDGRKGGHADSQPRRTLCGRTNKRANTVRLVVLARLESANVSPLCSRGVSNPAKS